MYNFSIENNLLEVKPVSEGIFRIRYAKNEEFSESLLSRYNILTEPDAKISSEISDDGSKISADGYIIDITKNGGLSFSSPVYSVKTEMLLQDEGYKISFSLNEQERIFGFGDLGRETIQKRGSKLKLWQKNVTGYGPIPYFMSSRGWGILLNSTYLQEYDIGCDVNDKITVSVVGGTVDFYIFLSDSMTDTIGMYTDIAGKPVVLPKFAYGFNFVCNEENGARDVLTDCYNFRKEEIPCDMVGLEPGWMEKHYDFSVDKKWHPERFYFPTWQPENYNGTWSFIYSLKKLGFKLCLWLCCDYDLLWEEEKSQQGLQKNSFEGAEIADTHFGYDTIMDKITKPGEAWFKHLEKFVDQGVAAFKLDGALQVLEHPDRLWAGKYFDREVHNVYPVIYSKQMQNGFYEYTGKRPLIYTPSAYMGIQKYAATWAGDTGGGPKTVVSILNYSMCGHSNTSCDMDPTDPQAIHYSFLMPWTQLLGWRNWHQPWFLGEKLKNIIKEYSHLRSSLFPYIYSMAHKAAKTGISMARPLALMHSENASYDNVSNLYYLGDSLLVGVFDMNFELPAGNWYDYFTEKCYSGSVSYVPPKNKGGALFVKAGSVIVTQETKQYLGEKKSELYYAHVYPGKDCSFTLVEDDGITYDYLSGAFSETKFEISSTTEKGFDFKIFKRSGSFAGRCPEEGHDEYSQAHEMSANTLMHEMNCIDGMGDVCDIRVVIHGCSSSAVVVSNEKLPLIREADGIVSFLVPASEHRDKDLLWRIEL